MKNVPILSFLFLLFTSSLFAQLENRFSIGPRVGVNFANINSSASKTLTGLAAGITSTYSINEKSGITVDLMYSGEGYKTASQKVALNYFKIPVLYNSFFGKLGEAFRPKIFIGLAPGFLLSATSNDTDIKSQNRSSTMDMVGGLGFNHRLNNRIWLNADLRAFFGLNSVTNSGDNKNRTIQASLGIAYGI